MKSIALILAAAALSLACCACASLDEGSIARTPGDVTTAEGPGLMTSLMIGAAGAQRFDGFHDAQLDVTCEPGVNGHERCYPSFAQVYETDPGLNLFADEACEVPYADVDPIYAYARSKSTGTVWAVSNTPSKNAYSIDLSGDCTRNLDPKTPHPLAHPAFLYRVDPSRLVRTHVASLH